jgi:uncharacterized protein YjaG (DUF416 family)
MEPDRRLLMKDYRGDLSDRISALPKRSQIAFAATCAEHLLPLYGRFSIEEGWGDIATFNEAVQMAWNCITGKLDESSLRSAIPACRELIPDMDDFHTGLASLALDAAVAALVTIEAYLLEYPLAKVLEAKQMADEAAFGLSHQKTFGRISTVIIKDVPEYFASLDRASTEREATFQDSVVKRLESVEELDPIPVDSLRELLAKYSLG